MMMNQPNLNTEDFEKTSNIVWVEVRTTEEWPR